VRAFSINHSRTDQANGDEAWIWETRVIANRNKDNNDRYRKTFI